MILYELSVATTLCPRWKRQRELTRQILDGIEILLDRESAVNASSEEKKSENDDHRFHHFVQDKGTENAGEKRLQETLLTA